MRMTILFCSIIGMVACNKKKEGANNEIILSKEKMIPLFIDMHLLEASTMQVAMTDSLVSAKAYNGYMEIFSNHNTTKAAFEEAIEYYSNRHQEMEEIMQAVVDSLTIRNSSH